MRNTPSARAIHPKSKSSQSADRQNWLLPLRATQTERLDQGEGSYEDACANLAEMWRINRYFGGVSALTAHLYPRLRHTNTPMRIADLGAGAGGFAAHLARWAQRHAVPLSITLLDFAHRHLVIAAENVAPLPQIGRVQADGLHLPFAPNIIDYFVSTLFLHHFEPESLVALLENSYRLARRGILMSDITRGYLPLAGFHLIRPLFARHELTYQDGLLSIRRAYTPSELAVLARKAGIPNARIHLHFPWRMTLVAEKSDV